MRRRRDLTSAERSLWRRAMVGTTPLSGREVAEVTDLTNQSETSPTPSSPREAHAVARPSTPRRAAALDPDRPIGLDRRNWLRLKRGQLEIEQILDLHGQTQAEAHARLDRFLARCHAMGRRCVLIVTGKGEASGGVLRHMVPRWLNEGDNRERVLAYCAAQRQHGGAGALYVLLRRRRLTD